MNKRVEGEIFYALFYTFFFFFFINRNSSNYKTVMLIAMLPLRKLEQELQRQDRIKREMRKR